MTIKRSITVFPVLSVLCLAAVILLTLFWVRTRQNSLAIKQDNLALKLGVVIEDYPYRTTFPEGYFYTILKPGMSIEEVHSTVKEYAQVFTCYGTDELYYYFSTKDEDALRFMIHYDNDGRYVRMYGEDDDSRTLSKAGCVFGPLEK